MALLKRQTQPSDPFSLSLPRYFYTPELKQRLNLTIHLLQNSEQLIFVLAQAGLGKSAFLTQLKKTLLAQHPNTWIHTLHAHPALSPEVFYSTLLTAFNDRSAVCYNDRSAVCDLTQPAHKPLSALQQSLRNHIASTRYSGQLPVLLVDDAHRLPLATLKIVTDLSIQGGPQTKLRVILFAQPQITSLLATPDFQSLQNSLTHTLDIPPFTQTQTRDYLQCRLENTHYHSLHLFTPPQLKRIYLETQGNPAHIHTQARLILEYHAKKMQPSALSGTAFRKIFFWLTPILILLCALLLIILYQNHSPLLFNEPSPFSPSKSTNEPQTLSSSSSLPPQITTLSKDSAPLPSYSTALADVSAPNFPSSAPSSLTAQQSATQNPPDTPLSLSPSLAVKDANWLRQYPPHHYTLQLLGAYQLSIVHEFIQHSLLPPQELAILKTTHQRKDWYVLTLGIYPTYAAAQQAQQQLPLSIRQNIQPWIRKLENIHLTQ